MSVRWLLVCALLVAACGAPPDSLYLGPGGDDSGSGGDGGLPPGPDYLAMAPDRVDCQTSPSPRSPFPARNVILFIGDGMGPEHLVAGRARLGHSLKIESLGVPVFVNTDSLTTQTSGAATDSAASATAIATGTLVTNGVLSKADDGAPLTTVAEELQAAGKTIGLVTTSHLYDATPMAFVAHTGSRWNTADILSQLFEDSKPDVVMGGEGSALDTEEELAPAEAQGYVVASDRDELSAWDGLVDPQLLGAFHPSAGSEWAMTPVLLRDGESPDPTLPEMAARALQRLALDADGFFLLVENEIIDEMGHRSSSQASQSAAGIPLEVASLDEAVGVAIDWVEANSSFDETLIVVAADHETGGLRFDPADGTIEFQSAGVHTRLPVAVFAKGPGAQGLADICSVRDLFLLLSGRL